MSRSKRPPTKLYSLFRRNGRQCMRHNLKLCLAKSLSINDKMVSFKSSKDVLKLLNVCRCFECFLSCCSTISAVFSFKEILVFGQEIHETAAFVQIRFFKDACGKKNIDHHFADLTKMAVRPSRSYLQFEDRKFSRWFHFSWEGMITNTLKVYFLFCCCWCHLRWNFLSLACCVVLCFLASSRTSVFFCHSSIISLS